VCPREPAHLFRFGTFEVNTAAGELRKGGIRLRIQDQPLRLLGGRVLFRLLCLSLVVRLNW